MELTGRQQNWRGPRMSTLLLVWCSLGGAALAEEVHFREQVAPIFQRHCLECHNDTDKEGDLSLQSRQQALSGGVIEPGNSEASRLLEVIVPMDGQAEMPPDREPLTQEEILVIRKWIRAGAEWPDRVPLRSHSNSDFDWWSLRPLVKPSVPKVSTSGEANTHPIDAFLTEKRQQKGLTPTPTADRRTLMRRLYFDLLGLPPSFEQVRAFEENASPTAYEELVDSLLASKHYGERWARHWLDVVHYADTHGYDKDKLRPHAWPYRDYVIRSLNEDKPYSRFIREQLAGDVLWPDTMDGITALGFIAAGPWDFIGHAEVPESKIDGRIARHLDRDDMVATTMNTFVSTTVQCARCHHHKFDPVTQQHYYNLQAVFAALDRADKPFDRDPNVAKKRSRLKHERERLETELQDLETRIEELGGPSLQDLKKTIDELERQQAGDDVRPEYGYHSQLAVDQDVVKWFQVDLGARVSVDRIELVGAYDDYAGIGAGFGFPLRYRIEISNDSTFEKSVIVCDRTAEDVPNPASALQSIACSERWEGRFVRMTATKLFHRQDAYIFALGEIRVVDADGTNVARGRPVHALDSIEAPPRWGRKNVVDGWYYGIRQQELTGRLATAQRRKNELLARVVPSDLLRQSQTATKDLERVVAEEGKLPAPEKVYAGTVHHGAGAFQGTGHKGGQPRTIHVLRRGNILQPTRPAEPGTIPLASGDNGRFSLHDHHREGERRLALADWIVAKQNPLTWRSIVNRVWQYHFGRGLVETANDFGRMGAQPSHPELLDWLAVEFRDGGQSLKQLHRLMVTSQAYRQATIHDAPNAALDEENVYLWRMNRRRLSAEEIRDAVLCASGKLNREMFGPGMQLFVLDRPEHSPHYEYQKHDPHDPASHRRSIYRFIVRSQPDPFMATFDCADSSQSVPKRIETVTPLQALSLLNNKFMLAMSEHFASRVRVEHDDLEAQVRRAFALALAREATAPEVKVLVAYAREFGLENTCRALFNLNEFVFVD